MSKRRQRTKIYSGKRDKNGDVVVHVVPPDGDSYLLPLRLDLFNHSPTGFEYGYGGSGPAQLALAIIADCLTDEAAIACHHKFKFKVIARLQRDLPWNIREQDVVDFVLDLMKQPTINGELEP